jgi:beta-mannosidase
MNRISLAGTWNITWSDGLHGKMDHFLQPLTDSGRYLPCPFPGSIQASLIANGWLEDPRVGINSLKSRWVEENFWILRRTFDIPAEAIESHPILHIEKLEGVAKVAVNGTLLGEHANAHRPVYIDLSSVIRPGENEIVIFLESGLFKVADLPWKDYSVRPETILNKRHHLRHAQYEFGWDWNPRLVFMGLHGKLEIIWGNTPYLEQVLVLAEVAEDLQSARLRLIPMFFVPSSSSVRVSLSITNLDGLNAEAEAILAAGEAELEVASDISQPKLWWPRGHGDPYLYAVTLKATCAGHEIARWEGEIGFRRIEIAQSPHPESGRYFHLRVNGRPIFCKGANWVPPELSPYEVANERVSQLVDLAEAENFNMLRVWGGGVWASHDLLKLCDQRGIMVWHDMLFACSKYPGDQPEFLAEVEREVSWGIREFSCHPSLMVWCGNNELEEGLWNWGYKQQGRTAPDYVLFHHVIPVLMSRIDPTRPYWPSSPYSSTSENPIDPTVGDQHPWTVSLGEDGPNFWAYRKRVDRFPNEGGVLGCAPLASLKKFLNPTELKMRSIAWEHHDNAMNFLYSEPGISYQLIEYWLGRQYTSFSLEEYIIASGLLQAEGLKEYILNYRRRWPSTASAIFWDFNDSWPTVHGWGAIDYYLHRKLAFHPVRRAFSPTTIALADEDQEVGVYVINDRPDPITVKIKAGNFVAEGNCLELIRLDCVLPPFSSQKVAVLPRDPSRINYALLYDAHERFIAQDRLLLRPFQAWTFCRPDIRIKTIKKADGRMARYESDVWIWGVVLDPSGESTTRDDVFDLFPGVAYDVPLGESDRAMPVYFTGNSLLLTPQRKNYKHSR